MNAHAPAITGRDMNETTRLAQQETMLSPRFYTTDFAEMDQLDISLVRKDWDSLIAELRADPNKGHFKREGDWISELHRIPGRAAPRVHGFSVSSLTSEFSGCILYAETKKRIKNPISASFSRL